MRCIRCDSMGCTLWYSLSTTQTTSDAFDSFLHSAPSENTHKRLRSKISSGISFWSSAWLLNRERLFAVVSYWFFDTTKLPILVHLARPSNQTTKCSLRRTLRHKSIEESSPWLLLKVSKIDTLKWFQLSNAAKIASSEPTLLATIVFPLAVAQREEPRKVWKVWKVRKVPTGHQPGRDEGIQNGNCSNIWHASGLTFSRVMKR